MEFSRVTASGKKFFLNLLLQVLAPVMPAAWEDSKKSMLCMGCILDNTFTFLVNVLNGGQLGAGDLLGSPG